MQLVLLPFFNFGVIIAYAVLASYVFFRDQKAPLNRIGALLLLAFAVWSWSGLMMQNPEISPATARAWANIGAWGWILFPALFLHLAWLLAGQGGWIGKWRLIPYAYLPAPLLLIAQVRDILISDCRLADHGWTCFWSGTVWPLYAWAYGALLVLAGLILLWRSARRADSFWRKQRLNFVLSSALAALASGLGAYALNRWSGPAGLASLAHAGGLILAAGLAHALAKYGPEDLSMSAFAPHIIATTSDALVLADQGGHILSVNPAALSLLGYGPDELKGRTLDLISGEMHFKNSLIGSAYAGSEYRDYYTSLTDKHNRKIPVMFSTAIIRDRRGQVKGVLCAARDISELKQKEKELYERSGQMAGNVKEMEKSERSLMQAFAEMSELKHALEEERDKVVAIIANFIDPILVVDKNNILSLVNPAAEALLRISRRDLGKKINPRHDYSLHNFSDFINIDYSLREIQTDSGQPMEELIIKNPEAELTYKIMTVPIKSDQGEYLGTMKIFNNLTREKTINKLKSEFISIAAHQLRTPMSAIKWAIRMVLDGDLGPLNDEQKSLLTKGYLSNERVISLINDMLNVSRIEEGRFGYNLIESDLVAMVKDLAGDFEPLIKEKQIDFKLDCGLEKAAILMDVEKMRLACRNLLENAFKYTPVHGRVEIRMEKSTDFIRVIVRDNGIGIPAADQAKLFSKFFRAQNALKAETDGSGLGLFIVKNVMEEHGGDISYQSREGRGTEFIFTLPLKR